MDPDEAAEAAGPTGLLAHPDPFALKGYRCNAPPVEAPYDDPDDNQKSLNDAFAPVEGWRIDGSTERRPAAFEAIKASLEAEGADSIYATAVDPETGVRPTHACAVNGYASLLKLLVEVGGCDPLAQVLPTVPAIRGRRDALWIAKRRGHKKVVEYLKSIEAVPEAHAAFDEMVVAKKNARSKAKEAARWAAAEEARARAAEEARIKAWEAEQKRRDASKKGMLKEIRKYEGQVKAYLVSFEPAAFKDHETGVTGALALIAEAEKLHAGEVAKLAKAAKFAIKPIDEHFVDISKLSHGSLRDYAITILAQLAGLHLLAVDGDGVLALGRHDKRVEVGVGVALALGLLQIGRAHV